MFQPLVVHAMIIGWTEPGYGTEPGNTNFKNYFWPIDYYIGTQGIIGGGKYRSLSTLLSSLHSWWKKESHSLIVSPFQVLDEYLAP